MNEVNFLKTFIDSLKVGTIVLNEQEKVLLWSQWLTKHTGITADQALDRKLSDIFSGKVAPKLVFGINTAVSLERVTLVSNRIHRHPLPLYKCQVGEKTREPLEHSIQISPLKIAANTTYCLIQIFDVSSEARKGQALADATNKIRETEDALEEHRLKMSAVFESARDGIFIFDDNGKFVTLNEAAAYMFGYQKEHMANKTIHDLITDIAKYKNHKLPEIIEILGSAKKTVEVDARKSCGTTFPVEFSVSRINTPEQPNEALYVSVVRDITERKIAEERLERLSHYDPMTRLPNRTLFRDRLDQAIRRSKRFGKYFIVISLDIDRFKLINDSLGHDDGDLLLVSVGERLKECFREVDTVARMGGDDFAILLEDIDKHDSALTVANKISEAFKPHFVVNGHKLFITTSLGVAVYPEAGETANELLRNSDAAMYSAKSKGRNSIEFYSAELSSFSTERLRLEKDLTHALENHEFLLNFQPLISLGRDSVFGAEALIRWIHPELGFIPPDSFIPVAEDTGLIIDIGKWVFETACRFCKRVNELGFTDFRIAINISPRQFTDPEFYDFMIAAIKSIDLSPSYIELEITENMLMENVDANVNFLKQLKQDGFRLSMDDFGTGYSSLSYINQFPLDTIKIDRSFVQGLPETLDSLSITKAILYMAKGLKLDVVAEGVETEQQKEFLKDELCELAQGYLISRPLAEEDFVNWIQQYDQ